MIFKRLGEEIDSIIHRDPAAGSRLEVVLCYPGFHALLAYRLSHLLWLWDLRLIARFLAYLAKVLTGVEIHPGATIGRRLFIDHATGVVIGQTAEIADDVTLYQGVTLGGTSLHTGKRHPTLENGVIVGAGAQVLGPITIGAGARIGANAVVITDVAAGSTMVGIPARVVQRSRTGADPDFCAYGTPEDVADPIVRAVAGLREQLGAAMERIEEMERQLEEMADREIDTPRK
ncbi:MAG: serine O-acetyltransferase [Alphaproteobacteria bacterium]|nr:serine O-acetyltransferase [Alphaproteobacteria bacterium]MBF0129395.1 serine O-acetyltransferase [Alphaproteobacteria bacterium]